ncbi:hypothetical protein WN943_009690 [Citrus x changshan-huyou]
MLSLQSLSFLHNKPILSLERLNHYVNNPSPSVVARAVENNNSQNSKFEIDPEEAKRALQRLDQQLKSLSNKQISSPKIKAADVKITRGPGPAEQETLEISGSFLTNTTVALLIFTILYNVLFYTVIKPSIDGPDDIPASAPDTTMATNKSPEAALVKELSPPPFLEDSVQR